MLRFSGGPLSLQRHHAVHLLGWPNELCPCDTLRHFHRPRRMPHSRVPLSWRSQNSSRSSKGSATFSERGASPGRISGFVTADLMARTTWCMGALVIDYKDMLERAAVSQDVCNEHNKANLRRAKIAHCSCIRMQKEKEAFVRQPSLSHRAPLRVKLS